MPFNTVGIQNNLPVQPVHVLQIIESLTYTGTYSDVNFFRQGRTNFGAPAFTSSAHVEMHDYNGTDPLAVYSNNTQVLGVDANGTTTVTSLTGSNMTVSNATISSETVTNSTIDTAVVTNASILSATISTLGATSVITNLLNVVDGTVQSLTSSRAVIGNETVTTATIGNLTSPSVNLTGSLLGNATSAATASYVTPLVQTVQITGDTRITGNTLITGEAQVTGSTALNGNLRVTGSEDILLSNTDYVNTAGANTHLLLRNTSPGGQTSIGFLTNNKLVGKIRSDYAGNMTYVASGSGLYGNHFFWVGGDYPQGTVGMVVSSSGQVGIGTQYPTNKLQVVGGVTAISFTGSLLGTASFASSASNAIAAITASYANSASQALTASFLLGGGGNGVPGGSAGQLQYNNGGLFAGVPTLTYNGTTLTATGSFSGSVVGNLTGTASFTPLVAGPGITVNGLQITASVRTVNGVAPVNGNVQASLSSTKTGTSASLLSSGSGTITGSLADGLVWIVAGDSTPSYNGDVWIYSSGSIGAWYPVAPLDTAAGDARYLMLDCSNDPLTNDLNFGGNDIINAGSINATVGLYGNIGSNFVVGPLGNNSVAQAQDAIHAYTASFVTSSDVFGPYGAGSVTSASVAVTATTASFVTTAETASYVVTAATSSYPFRVTGSSIYSANTIGVDTITGVYIGQNAASGTVGFGNDDQVAIGQYAGARSYGANRAIYIGANAGQNAAYATCNIGIGNYATQATNNSNDLVGIGVGALNSVVNTYDATAMGTYAGSGASRSSYSNMLGYWAGWLTTDAANANFLGYYAGYSASFAASSNFIGYEAGRQARQSNKSNFIGYQAGKEATGANNSNFIGEIAGYQAGGSQYSNFIGTTAGYLASNTDNANFIGFQAGAGATGAHLSNFIGFQAGQSSRYVTGSNFIGYGAGNYAVSASNSVIIGYQAGQNFVSDFFAGYAGVGKNNIIIGTGITLPEGAKDSINLGGIIFATGSYGNTTYQAAYSGSRYGIGRVGINVVSPEATLHVSGTTKFGAGITDTHQITGSLQVTGSIYLNGTALGGGGTSNGIQSVDVTLTQSDILTLTTAKTVIPAPGVGYGISPISLALFWKFGTTPYVAPNNLQLKITNSVYYNSNILTVAEDYVTTNFPSPFSGQPAWGYDNVPMVAIVNGTAPTGGDCTLKLRLFYTIIPLT